MKKGSFFKGYEQKKIPIRQFKGKTPLFYQDLNLMGCIFTADLKTIKKYLPSKEYHPLSILPGRGLAAIHCVEYKQSDIGPYNEVSLSIAVQYGKKSKPVPIHLLQSALKSDYHGYIKELPVTTDVALYGGIDFFNYPKYLADISFRETSSHRVCTLRDKESLDLILEFEAQKIKTRNFENIPFLNKWSIMTLNAYPIKKGKPVHAKTLIHQKEFGVSFLIPRVNIRLGDHFRSKSFRELDLGKQIQFFYSPSCEGILFEPEDMD